MKKMHATNRGFVLLLAVLVSGILLALGVALYNIASKELILSSSGRDSQFAFYAADSGIECALYWDAKHDAFATTSSLTQVTCGSGTLPSPGGGGRAYYAQLRFRNGNVYDDVQLFLGAPPWPTRVRT